MFMVFRRQAVRWGIAKVSSVVLVALLCSSPTKAQNSLTLQQATQRVLEQNPDLQVFQWRLQALSAQKRSADLRPAYQLGMEVENLAGGGDYQDFDSAEVTLSLSSLVELGGKRNARVSVAESRYGRAQIQRQAQALDLLAGVTQRFIAVLSLQEKLRVAKDATTLAADTLTLIQARVDRGASPRAEALRANVALMTAQQRQAQLQSRLRVGYVQLASLWMDTAPDFDVLNGDLFALPPTDPFDALLARVDASPAMGLLTSEARVRDAEVALARSQAYSDIQWSLGVRYFEDSGDGAFTVGLSAPLASARRNRGNLDAALAERNAVDVERQAKTANIRARLFEAWELRQQQSAAAEETQTRILPMLRDALRETQKAYERGSYGYLEWVAAQEALLNARLAGIDQAASALLNQALIEQLTAEPLTAESHRSNPHTQDAELTR